MKYALIVFGSVHELWNEYPVVADGLDIREVSDAVQEGWIDQNGELVEPTPPQPEPSFVAGILIKQFTPVVTYYFTLGEDLPDDAKAYLATLRAAKASNTEPEGGWPTRPADPADL